LKLWPILIASILGLFVSGCQKAKPIERISVQNTRLDRDLIERSVLSQEWRSIRRHILQVNGDALSPQNQSYALYWLGVAQFKLGDEPSAKRSWERALERRPDTRMTEMIRRAFKETYAAPTTRFPDLNEENIPSSTDTQWILQLGIFSLKSTAERLVNKLNHLGIFVKLREAEFNGRTSWTVWSGPYSNREANTQKRRLQNQGYAAILKSAESFL
jgi:hypothetical protein